MKKIIAVFGIVGIALSLCACGNMSPGFGNYTYDKVHVDTHHYTGCLELEKWYENGMGIEVRTEEFGGIFLSEGTYTLIQSKCPFCEGEER